MLPCATTKPTHLHIHTSTSTHTNTDAGATLPALARTSALGSRCPKNGTFSHLPAPRLSERGVSLVLYTACNPCPTPEPPACTGLERKRARCAAGRRPRWLAQQEGRRVHTHRNPPPTPTAPGTYETPTHAGKVERSTGAAHEPPPMCLPWPTRRGPAMLRTPRQPPDPSRHAYRTISYDISLVHQSGTCNGKPSSNSYGAGVGTSYP